MIGYAMRIWNRIKQESKRNEMRSSTYQRQPNPTTPYDSYNPSNAMFIRADVVATPKKLDGE